MSKPPVSIPVGMAHDAELRGLAELAELGVAMGGLLHEIRQPLFVTKGLLQLARAEGRTPSAEEVAQALEQLAHLEELVEHYGHLGRKDDSLAEVDALDVARRVALTVSQRAARVRAEVVVRGEPVIVTLRPVALRQVLLNLVGNAIDAVEDRPERRIVLEVGLSSGWAVIAVTDTGPGVAPGIAARLFDPFVTTKAPGRGTGLGLWIARSLAEETGGTIGVAATGSAGTRVELRIPLTGPRLG